MRNQKIALGVCITFSLFGNLHAQLVEMRNPEASASVRYNAITSDEVRTAISVTNLKLGDPQHKTISQRLNIAPFHPDFFPTNGGGGGVGTGSGGTAGGGSGSGKSLAQIRLR